MSGGKRADSANLESEGSLRVLILLASERDSLASAKTMAMSGCASYICKDARELCAEIARGAGALLVGTEILNKECLPPLTSALCHQPAWSHIPVIVLLSSGEILTSVDPSFRELEPLGNVTLLEGPVRLSTLVSTVRASIAYRKRQYQMRGLLTELEESRHEAVEANRAKSDFLANMSHEIRTPLGAVMGFSELLMEPDISEREKQVYMTTIRRNGQMLSALIDDILDLAKVESGRIEIEDMDFSLGEMISEVISSLEPQSSRKGLRLNVERGPNTPETIRTDPIRLKQILMNIIGNAIKFTNMGSVQVRLEGQSATATGELSELRIHVEDSGIGISEAQTQRLFQPFTQADTSTTRRFGGTGLGLVLSRKLAQALGGDLALKWSVPGGGSCFEILLAVGVVAEPAGQRPAEAPSAATPGPLSGCRILVVDDSLDNQLLIGRTLKLLGAQIELASDGLEAVHMATRKSYDVVLMDLQMPKLGGVEATKILREQGYSGPIVALTAHALKEDRLRCLRVGCTDYLTKPIQRASLVRVLERVTKP